MSEAAIRNRAQQRAHRRGERRKGKLHYPSSDQINMWVAIEEAKAKEQGREHPNTAVRPDDVGTDVFHGILNSLGRKPTLVRFRACLGDAQDVLLAGDLRAAEAALRTLCSLLPNPDKGDPEEEAEFDAFYEAAGGDAALDALEFGSWAVQDGKVERALGLIGGYLDGRPAA